jgi:hypothetical protein
MADIHKTEAGSCQAPMLVAGSSHLGVHGIRFRDRFANGILATISKLSCMSASMEAVSPEH